jgi:hypothetical protein
VGQALGRPDEVLHRRSIVGNTRRERSIPQYLQLCRK